MIIDNLEELKVIKNLMKMAIVGLAEMQRRLPEPECYLVGDVANETKKQLDMLSSIDFSNTINKENNGSKENNGARNDL